jgi:hypothetical protein
VKQFAIALLLSATMILVGCQPTEMNARDAIASAKGFIDQVATNHPECNAAPAGQVCVLVSRANAVKHTAIDALQLYCSGPSFDAGTGPCQPPTDKAARDQAATKLKAAVTNLNQIVSDIKAIGGK